MRGGGVLNSRAEFSRCHLPRLVIDHESWRMNKVNEKKSQETITEEDGFKDGEDWEAMVSSLMEDEIEMVSLQKKAKNIVAKRKAEETGKPAKRKKLNNIDGWGEQGALKEDEVDIREWLQEREIQYY